MDRGGARLDVLVIEDDQDIAEFMADLLRFEGYRVGWMADGGRLEEIVSAPPRMIFLDLMLPEPDGAAICQYLRAERRTHAMPIVMMTAASAGVRAQRLRGCVYDALLTKPFDVDDVLALAAHYLRPDPASATAGDTGTSAGSW